MTGTNNEKAYDTFVAGSACFPITSSQGLVDAIKKFNKAIDYDDNYARAYGWLSYAYVTSFIDGWKLKGCGQEAKWSEKKLLDTAEKYAKKAVTLAPMDYDTHWALAFVYLNRRKFKEAIDEYDQALYLNQNDNNPHLLAEMADALVYVGDTDRGIKMIKRARRVRDWHRWVLAWAYYFKGVSDAGYYDLALDELRQMYHTPVDDAHLCECDLLTAAIHAQKASLLTSPKQVNAQKRLAKEALKQFRKKRRGWSIKDVKKSGSFKNRADEKHWIDGVRKAGLK